MRKLIGCEFNFDTVCVELKFSDGSIVNMGVKDEHGKICYIIGVLKSIRKLLGKKDGDSIQVKITA